MGREDVADLTGKTLHEGEPFASELTDLLAGRNFPEAHLGLGD